MFFFEGTRGRRLLGFLHAPDAKATPRMGLVYCHPFAEERNQSQGVAVRAARALASRGYAVLRFDFSGCGDSEGLLEDASAEDWIAEIGLALAELRRRAAPSKAGVWGLRAGANLAARFADGRADLQAGVFWQPFPDLKLAMTQFLRQKLSTSLAAGEPAAGGEKLSVKSLVQKMEAGETVEVMGYPVRHALYAGLTAADKPFAASRFAFPVCIAAITEAEAPPEGLRRIHESLAAANPKADLIHVRTAPFWDRYWRWDDAAVAGETARWLANAA